MHVQHSTAFVLVALVSALVLLFDRRDRLFPVLAFVATGIAALIHFGVITLSLGKFRVDVILPGITAVAAVWCWSKATDKTSITAATTLAALSTLQLLTALGALA